VTVDITIIYVYQYGNPEEKVNQVIFRNYYECNFSNEASVQDFIAQRVRDMKRSNSGKFISADSIVER
jgi:hypothetical protein